MRNTLDPFELEKALGQAGAQGAGEMGPAFGPVQAGAGERAPATPSSADAHMSLPVPR